MVLMTRPTRRVPARTALLNRLSFQGVPEAIGFSFAAPVSFTGLWLAGPDGIGDGSYSVLLGGVVQATVSFVLSETPAFVSTGFTGAVDQVTINATRGYYAFDDVTYDALGGAVPEPATWAFAIGGVGIVGAAMRRRNRLALRLA